MDSNNPKLAEGIRRLAAFEASAASESRSKFIDDHSAAFRWMIASLFALNGGAILTIFGAERLSLQATFPAFWVFFAGIVSTFLAVFLCQLSDRAMIARVHNWGLYWTTVEVSGERDEAREAEIKVGIASAEKLGRWGRLNATFGMLFFIMGVLTTVVLEQKRDIAALEIKLQELERASRHIEQ